MPKTQRLSENAWDSLTEALAVFYWRKAPFEAYLRSRLRDFPELLAPLSFAGTKRSVVSQLVLALRTREDRYRDVVLDMLVNLSEFDDRFPHLAREENGEDLLAQARIASAEVRRVVAAYAEDVRERERLQAELAAEAEASAQRRDHSGVLAELLGVFYDLHAGDQTPQQRGKQFEGLLNRLFALFDLEPRAAYAIEREQIDGMFAFNTDHYLLEARWWKGPVEPKHLRDFEGKIRTKARNVLGLFISVNGFTLGAQTMRSEANPLVLMDGADLLAVLEGRIDLLELLDRKRRHAAQTGSAWLPAKDILNS